MSSFSKTSWAEGLAWPVSLGTTILHRSVSHGPDWVPAVVIERLGLLTYWVETTDDLFSKDILISCVSWRWIVKQRLHSLQSCIFLKMIPLPWVHLLKSHCSTWTSWSEQGPRYCPWDSSISRSVWPMCQSWPVCLILVGRSIVYWDFDMLRYTCMVIICDLLWHHKNLLYIIYLDICCCVR